MMKQRDAKFQIGQVVRHRVFPFRGVIFDVDPTFSNTEEWYAAIPEEVRPARDQPFYHLLAENSESEYVAYVSEQNLLPDTSGDPVRHPQVAEIFRRTSETRAPSFVSTCACSRKSPWSARTPTRGSAEATAPASSDSVRSVVTSRARRGDAEPRGRRR